MDNEPVTHESVANEANSLEEHAIAEGLAGTDDDIYGGDDDLFDMEAATTLGEHIAIETVACEELKSEHSRRVEQLKQAKEDLYNRAKAAGMEKFTTTGGLSLSLSLKTKYGKGKGVNDDQLFGFLRGANMGDIIKETVHHGTLGSAMKEFVESGGEFPDVATFDKEGNESNGPVINTWDEKGVRLNNKGKFVIKHRADLLAQQA